MHRFNNFWNFESKSVVLVTYVTVWNTCKFIQTYPFSAVKKSRECNFVLTI